MTNIVYLGFDPGAITGIAWTSLDDDRSKALTGLAATSMQACDTIYQILKWYNHLEDEPRATRIIVAGEPYTMGSSIRTHQPDALRILGAVRWMIHKFFPGVEYTETGASAAAQTGNRKNLTAAGWWIPADPDQHRNKAAAQVAHAMMMTEPRRWYDLINPEESDKSDEPNRSSVRGEVSEV